MSQEPTLCVVCAWRKDCNKKFLRSPSIASQCVDFTKDLSIETPEKTDDKKKDSPPR